MFHESKLDDGDMRQNASGGITNYSFSQPIITTLDPILCFDGKKVFQIRRIYRNGEFLEDERVDVTAEVAKVLLGRLQ